MKTVACLLSLVATLAAPCYAGTLFKSDFNAASPWTQASSSVFPASVSGALIWGGVGTVDVADSTTLSNGYRYTVSGMPTTGSWQARFNSGLIPVSNPETNLGKITLAFILNASSAKPVTVRVESFNAGGTRTGGLSTVIYPAAPNFYQRYALDLNTMKADGAGTFNPTDPKVQFSYEISNVAWASTGSHVLRVDNVQYATPKYYVKPAASGGSDSANGLTEATAFATPQKALNAAQAGDIIMLKGGTYGGYNSTTSPVATFKRAGTPDAWISLKNYPGETPTLTSNGWNIVSMQAGYNGNPDSVTSLNYLEVRGLRVRGEGDVVRTKYPTSIGQVDSRSNSNGIAVDGRYMANVPHHIRIADNIVEYCPGCGIAVQEGDWSAIENNTCRFNSWTTIYATSGISILGASNFDAQSGVYKHLVRNNICHRNETFEKWTAIGKISDGNGIIIDLNHNTDDRPDGVYLGRTLVQSNLSYDNGGSGIHAYKADHVDIIGNTAYLNSASVALEYGQIFANNAKDVRIINNILVARVANLAAGEKKEPVNGNSNSPDAIYANNLYFGGNIAPVMGTNDVIGDPRFATASIDDKVADFRIRTDSPALGTGTAAYNFAPYLDLNGVLRLAIPSKGALEQYTPRLVKGR